jgi:hypothetical protein
MGSSDPLPARFEISGARTSRPWGMTTSCASPTVLSFTCGGRPGQDWFQPRLLLTLQRLHRWTQRALQHLDADGVLANARARREWNDIGPRAWRHNTTRSSAGRRRGPQGCTWPARRNSATGCATPRQPTLCLLAPTWWHTRICPATTCWRSGTSSPPPTTSRTTAPQANCPPPRDLAWVCGVGLR